eukprot:3713172-Prymnesium_polylepis.1
MIRRVAVAACCIDANVKGASFLATERPAAPSMPCKARRPAERRSHDPICCTSDLVPHDQE